MTESNSPVTELLGRAGRGDQAATAEVLDRLYAELRGLAQRLMQDERRAHTLQPTALVHEAWLRIFDGAPLDFESRRHFLRLAARAMRHVLVDHARGRLALKRGGGRRDADGESNAALLDAAVAAVELEGTLDVVALHTALARLTELDPQAGEIVELRFFGGLSITATASALDVSTSTVERSWRAARLWLARELNLEPPGSPGREEA